jgi:glutamate dehydrogenase (NADP+)
VVVSGSGNVALHTIEKVLQLGGRVIACSDSNGTGPRDNKRVDGGHGPSATHVDPHI